MTTRTRSAEEKLLWPSRGRVGLVVLVMLLSCTVCRTNQEAQGYTNIIFLTQPTSQYTVVVGRMLSLPCRAQGVNSQGETEFLSVIFYKNNEMIPIYPIEDYQYLFDSTSRTTTGLVSPQTSITDDGATFQCKLLLAPDDIMTPPITVTVADGRPGAITLIEHSITSTSFTVTWDASLLLVAPLGYNVSLFTQDGSLIYTHNITNGTISSYTFDGLEPDTEYQVLVVAYNMFGVGDTSDLLPIKTSFSTGSLTQNSSLNTVILIGTMAGCTLLIIIIIITALLIGLRVYMKQKLRPLNERKSSKSSSIKDSSFELSTVPTSNGKATPPVNAMLWQQRTDV